MKSLIRTVMLTIALAAAAAYDASAQSSIVSLADPD